MEGKASGKRPLGVPDDDDDEDEEELEDGDDAMNETPELFEPEDDEALRPILTDAASRKPHGRRRAAPPATLDAGAPEVSPGPPPERASAMGLEQERRTSSHWRC